MTAADQERPYPATPTPRRVDGTRSSAIAIAYAAQVAARAAMRASTHC